VHVRQIGPRDDIENVGRDGCYFSAKQIVSNIEKILPYLTKSREMTDEHTPIHKL
jgi:hypothetical protein